MTIAEFYAYLGEDYETVKTRLVSEKLVKRLLVKYPNDKNFGELAEGMKEKDYEKAFTAAHTIKGVALNMGFDRLQNSASNLSEAFKKKEYDRVEDLFREVESAQTEILEGLSRTELD